MSYYTFAHLQYLSGDPIPLSPSQPELLKLLDDEGLHHDVARGLADLFGRGEASFTFYGGCAVLAHLLCGVSRQWPACAFGVQGRGEDVRDVWVREFEGGEVTFEQGPFNE